MIIRPLQAAIVEIKQIENSKISTIAEFEQIV